MIDITLVRPALYNIRFHDTDDSPIRKRAKFWGWNRLIEVTECMRIKTQNHSITPEILVRNFGVFNGHMEKGPVVTLIGHSEKGLDCQWNQSVSEAVLREGYDYFIPAAWGCRMTDEWPFDSRGIVSVELCFIGDNPRHVKVYSLGGISEYTLPIDYCPHINERHWGGK